MAKEIFKVEKLLVRANFVENSFNEKERTVDVIFATETLDVTRYDYRNSTYFIEQLVLTPESVRLDRLNAGAPFLDNHISYGSVRNGLGTVVKGSARLINGRGACTVKFSSRKDVADIMRDVKEGTLENISVGYTVYKYERQPVVDGETPIYRVIDWEPFEVSLVSIPADISAGVGRSLEKIKDFEPLSRVCEIEVIDAEGVTGERSGSEPVNKLPNNNPLNNRDMTLEQRALAVGLQATATLAQVEAAERKLQITQRALAVGLTHTATEAEVIAKETANRDADIAAAVQRGIEAEQSRHTEITNMVRVFGLPAAFGEKLITDKTSIDNARKLAQDELAKTDPKLRGQNITVTGKDETEKERTGMVAGLLMRSGAVTDKSITAEERELGKRFANRKLIDIARMCCERIGIDTRDLDDMEIASRAITSNSSDFPILLAGTNRRILLDAYNVTADKWKMFCKIGSVSDFREWDRLRPGSISRLDALNENGTYKTKALADATKEKVQIGTFGNIINLSRKMIVNDDLGGFTDITRALGRAAARSIEIDVFALFGLNGGFGPLMTDGLPLFDAAHGNLIAAGAGGTPITAQFEKVRNKFARMTDEQANDYLDIASAIWVGPSELLSTANTTNGSLFDPEAVNKLQKPNSVKDMFKQLIGTPRLGAASTPWYAFADPSDVPAIEVSFLNGQQAPHLESEIAFNQDGIAWKVRHDYGVSAIDYKGVIMNAGA